MTRKKWADLRDAYLAEEPDSREHYDRARSELDRELADWIPDLDAELAEEADYDER